MGANLDHPEGGKKTYRHHTFLGLSRDKKRKVYYNLEQVDEKNIMA
jgi:hypothetical protein